MYPRNLMLPLQESESIFLFGPRGTGKTHWLLANCRDAIYIDLLKHSTYQKLLRQPDSLEDFIPKDFSGWIVIDEVQKIPALMDEIHYQIERKQRKFVLTGSSSRSLKRKGVNLLAGRALQYHMHPLTAQEIGGAFDWRRALKYGLLPKAQTLLSPQKFLETYVQSYIREEVFQESLTRNIQGFQKFIEVASYSQGQPINLSNIAREVGIDRATVQNYFDILVDLLIAVRIFPFTKRAQRSVTTHPKFYYFDVGVYRVLRPQGYLDSSEEIEGPGLETLVLQSLRAINEYESLGYEISFWQTASQIEVDFILYGKTGLIAIEVKRSSKITSSMLKGLKEFQKDYPEASCYCVYSGEDLLYFDTVKVIPIAIFLKNLPALLKGEPF